MFKRIASFIIRYSGIPFLIRNIYAKNKVTILYFHNPSPDCMLRSLNYLSKHYNFISLDLLVDSINKKKWTQIPAKSLIVTMGLLCMNMSIIKTI